ncbi:MAG: uroporphyrinogen-III C-methyltransferase [Gammaproteobacteria bacterium]
MSEESRQTEEETGDASVELDLSEDADTRGQKIPYAALLLSLIALGAAAAGFYFQYQARDAEASRAGVFDEVTSQLNNVEGRIDQLVSQRQSLQDRITQLQEKQEQLTESVDNLYRQQKRVNIDWAIAEIEHLLVIAEHSLALNRDLETALAALGAADDRLRSLGEPGLLAVRKQLQSDINNLKSVDDVDISGLSLYLADLAGRVERLPLQEREAPEQAETGDPREVPQDESAPAWKRLLSGIWQEVKSLVVITRSDEAGQALLMPEERYFLYQNLRLQLESARANVLRRDTDNFRASLDLVITWLEEYFDTTSSAVDNVIQSLREMKRLQLERDLPDISSSLETLNAWIKDRARSSRTETGEPTS